MSNSTLALTLLGMNTNPEVVEQLLTQTTFPRERPSYWVRYPNIGADLPTKAAIDFARKSVMHALTIALSSATGPQTLDELSKFTQKSVKRAIAAHPGLWDQTTIALARWACKNEDTETLHALAINQDPRAWAPVIRQMQNHGTDAWSNAIGSYLASVKDPGTLEELFVLVPTWETLNSEGQPCKAQVEYLNQLQSGKAACDVNPVSMLKLIADRKQRLATALLSIPPNFDGHSTKVNDDLVDLLLEDHRTLGADSVHMGAAGRHWNWAHLVFSDQSAAKLTAASPGVLDLLLYGGIKEGARNWSAQTYNEAVLATGERFIQDRSVHMTSELEIELLTDQAFTHLVEHLPPETWDRVSQTKMVERLATLDPATALRLALLLPASSLHDYIVGKGQVPSFSPAQFNAALRGPLNSIGHRRAFGPVLEGGPGAVPIHASYLFSPFDRSETRPWFTALHQLVGNQSLFDTWKPSGWLMELLNLASDVVGPRALGRGEDPTVLDVWTYAVHQHLDAVIHDIPDAWVPALSLLASWHGTLTELALVSAESTGCDVSALRQQAQSAETGFENLALF